MLLFSALNKLGNFIVFVVAAMFHDQLDPSCFNLNSAIKRTCGF